MLFSNLLRAPIFIFIFFNTISLTSAVRANACGAVSDLEFLSKTKVRDLKELAQQKSVSNATFGGILTDYLVPSDSACYSEPGARSFTSRVVLTVLAIVFFSAVFCISMHFLPFLIKQFENLSVQLKADNCSRINSTIHSLVVCPCLVYGLFTVHWGPNLEPLSSVRLLQDALCISVAYFFTDALTMIIFKVPMWKVFFAHHIVALTPYCIYLYTMSCGFAVFSYASMMLVEITNITLNTQSFLSQLNYGDTRLYAFLFYCTYVLWIVFRIANPIQVAIVMHMHTVKTVPKGRIGCVIPAFICTYIIMFFCFAGFIVVLTKELIQRWLDVPEPGQVAPHRPPSVPRREPSPGASAPEVLGSMGRGELFSDGSRSFVADMVGTSLRDFTEHEQQIALNDPSRQLAVGAGGLADTLRERGSAALAESFLRIRRSAQNARTRFFGSVDECDEISENETLNTNLLYTQSFPRVQRVKRRGDG